MNSIIYIIGAIVVIVVILKLLGLYSKRRRNGQRNAVMPAAAMMPFWAAVTPLMPMAPMTWPS